ncbi:hypothetical protein TSOC_014440, partial [Tetrabaena socialis]
MALLDALNAKWLPAAAARLAGVPGSGPPLDAGETERLACLLTNVSSAFVEDDDSFADAFLADDRLCLALLHLVAFALRIPRQSDLAVSRVAACVLRASASLLKLDIINAWRARAMLDFARKLLRMGTLQCCSIAFSERAAALTAAGEAGEAGAGVALAGSAAALESIQALQCMWSLVNDLLDLATWLDATVGTGFTARQVQQIKDQQRLCAREAAASLGDSRYLEHGARLALHVQLAISAGWVPELYRKDMFRPFTQQFSYVIQLSTVLADDAVAAFALREALSGPCVRHLALSLGLAALCAADGGPSHGLPPELLLRLPILGRVSEAEDLRSTQGRQQLFDRAFSCMLRVLEDSTTASATPPRDWRSMVGLLRRIGSLLLTSARSWADEGADEGAEAEAGPLQLVLAAADLIAVALPLLGLFRRLVSDQQAAAIATPAALAEAEAAWWRLAVDAAAHCARLASPETVGPLAELLCFDSGPLPKDGPRPAAAPPVLAPALAGGLLPLWEQLLRCTGRQPDCPEASLLFKLLGTATSHERFCNMLVYGEPRQSAALVATWGKLLRTLAVPQLLSGLREGRVVADTRRTQLASALANCAAVVLRAVLERLAAAGRHDAAAVDPSPPQLQLARLASYAACEWLPLLARLAREGLPMLQRAPDAADQGLYQLVRISALAVVRWLPVLAQCSKPAQGNAAMVPPPVAPVRDAGAAQALEEGTVAARISDAPAAAGWQQLLREVGAVALLGIVCELAWASSPGELLTSIRPLLPSCCCCVAAACPGEVRQAVLAAAAEATAATSSG